MATAVSPLESAHRILGSDVRRIAVGVDLVQPMLVTWFVDHHGDKQEHLEPLGEPYLRNEQLEVAI